MFELPPLPYRYGALEPWIGAAALRFHHDVLQRRYVDRLNHLVGDNVAPLESIIRDASPGPILDNALQVWNHTFLWHSMRPPAARPGVQGLSPSVVADFVQQARGVFGSGYVWLLANPAGDLEVWTASNAGNPLRDRPDHVPLLTLDLWEHAFLFDYGADREAYVRAFVTHLANWDFAQANYQRAIAV